MNNSKHANLSMDFGLDVAPAPAQQKPAPGVSPVKAIARCQPAIAAHPGEQTEQFPSLDLEKRPLVQTAQAAHYLNRRPQTLRSWASAETFPEGLRPVRVNGRLGWPVQGIRRVLGVTA